jgi:hypothetical protein
MGETKLADYQVRPVTRKECAPFILGIHYARRWPSISYAFGLYRNEELVGVVTYGTPFSSTLRAGVAGKDMAEHVIELNRLCLRYNLKNEASRLVGASLRKLPKGKIVVSFADTNQNHKGIVYQACSFTYHGLSAKRTDWKIKGKEHLHGQTISDEFRGCKNRAQAARDKYGSDFYLSPRPRKHRYIYITGSSKQRKEAFIKIRYKQEPFPKTFLTSGN